MKTLFQRCMLWYWLCLLFWQDFGGCDYWCQDHGSRTGGSCEIAKQGSLWIPCNFYVRGFDPFLMIPSILQILDSIQLIWHVYHKECTVHWVWIVLNVLCRSNWRCKEEYELLKGSHTDLRAGTGKGEFAWIVSWLLTLLGTQKIEIMRKYFVNFTVWKIGFCKYNKPLLLSSIAEALNNMPGTHIWKGCVFCWIFLIWSQMPTP